MGKTHLMQAIGHEIKKRMPQAAICYVSSEKFTNEMINSLRYDKMTSFRDKFRNVDVLLVDDIQFLAQKERTQEEFFHTFNALHESMKQIVIASDRPPKELAEVEDRLAQPLRVGTDRRHPAARPRNQGRDSAEESRAGKSHPADRRGALHRLQHPLQRSRAGRRADPPGGALVADRRRNHPALHPAGAQEFHRLAGPQGHDRVHPEGRTAEQFGLRLVEIKAKNNSRAIVYPRQIAMYLAKHLTEASLPEIGRQFGGKHHTTVLHSVEKIDEARKTDKDLNRLINKMTEQLGG